MKKFRNIFKIILVVIVLSIIWWYRDPLFDLLKIIGDQQAVSDYLVSYGPLGLSILFILIMAQVFIAFIPGHALIIAAGYAYGMPGFLVVVTSTIIGSQIAFLVTRYFGHKLIYKLSSPKTIQRWKRIAQHQGILFYFFSFVLPFFPSDLMCFVAGMDMISPRRFFVANVLGRTCSAILLTLIGLYGLKPPLWLWITSIVSLSAFFVGWMIYKKQNYLKPNVQKSSQNT